MLNINAIWQGAQDMPALIILAGAMALYFLSVLAACLAERKQSSRCLHNVKAETVSDDTSEAPDMMALWLGCGLIHS